MPATTIVSVGEHESDECWDEKLHGVDDGIQVIAIRLWRMLIAGDGIFKHHVVGTKLIASTEGTNNCQRAKISTVKEAEGFDEQVAAKDWKDYGITPSRDPSERYDGPSKDCLWDGFGRQLVPKSLSGKQDDNDEEKEQEEDIAGGPGGGRNPGDNDDGELMQRQVAMKFEPPPLLAPPKLVLDSISSVTAKAELLKLQRLEHGQLEYFPIYGNGFRYQPLRTEHHCSWSAKIALTHEDRPIISPQQMQEHYSWLPEAMELRERWMKKQRWRRLGKNLMTGDIKKAINGLLGVWEGD